MRVVREEILGPVMSVLTFADEAEAIARANATDFGLGAGLMTRYLSRATGSQPSWKAAMCGSTPIICYRPACLLEG